MQTPSPLPPSQPPQPSSTPTPPPPARPTSAARPIIVGIDLGTTNSLVALADQHGPRILLDSADRPLLPSVVRFNISGPPTVGYHAKQDAALFPATTIASVKRLMGRSIADLAPVLPLLTFSVAPAPQGDAARIALPLPSSISPQLPASPATRLIAPEEVSAHILATLKLTAEQRIGSPVLNAVITVPAYFDDAQRQATRAAARLAGLNPVRILPEPTAAALAYGIGLDRASERLRRPSTVAVYDLGGGTFDVSILTLTPSGTLDDPTQPTTHDQPAPSNDAAPDPFFFQVLATSGDTQLGGDDFDQAIVEDMLTFAQRTTASPFPTQLAPGLRRSLLAAAEQLKHTLSTQLSASAQLTLSPTLSFPYTITREHFESLIAPLIRRTLQRCSQALLDSKLDATIDATIDATLDANVSSSVTPPTTAGSTPAPSFPGLSAVILVGGSTRVPIVKKAVANFFGLIPYDALDPDTVVALGAAVQASVLSGTSTGTLLLDVIPLSLGIETVGGAVAKLITRNSLVPVSATEMFSTSVDGQTAITLAIYQGEREMAADCRKLSQVVLRGLPPMPAGVPQVQVKFLVDANGVLSVSALERRSGKRIDLQVIPNHGLSPEEARQAELAAYANARTDMHRHRITDLITNASLDLKWISDAQRRVKDQLEPAYETQLTQAAAALSLLITEAKANPMAANADALAAAKDALDRLSLHLHEIAIAHSLRGTITDH